MNNASTVNINVQCECYHRRGLFYYANPLAWGRPCRKCRRMLSRNNIVVSVPAAQVQPAATAVVPAQCQNNCHLQQQPQMVSTLPPKYEQAIAGN
ncbi:uncharacterized protein LOC108091419 [Drosophila ficusphila]|uniref:uncharacterized protein LOC108091419 n=1 Tax=Drosophila ficusphila TaxID=30025 RepID=UPI0007E746BF|nr:uncharacterized protein LOC108091419 [Drosophila ficusphila]